MTDENMTPETEVNDDLSLDDLAEFGTSEEVAVTLDEEQVVLAEDLEGFAKGFPSWDLLPPED